MGKFNQLGINPYWKHDLCIDAFFRVDKVKFDENGTHATVQGCWMVQGVDAFWSCTRSVRLNIRPEQYKKWHRYMPQGNEYV